MKILVALLLVSFPAFAWTDHLVKPSCGCWRTTISFSDEFHIEAQAESDDTSVLLLATFRGEAKMDSLAGKFHFETETSMPATLVLSFRLGGKLVAARLYPELLEPRSAYFVTDEKVLITNRLRPYVLEASFSTGQLSSVSEFFDSPQ